MSYLLLFFWCFLAASLVPVTCEPYFTALVVKTQTWIFPLIVATIGNTLGSITTFLIGRKTAALTLKKMSEKNKQRFERAQNLLHTWGPMSLILAWVFVLGDLLVGIAGALHLNFWKSVFWITIGKLLRFAIIALITLQIIT